MLRIHMKKNQILITRDEIVKINQEITEQRSGRQSKDVQD